MNRLLQKENVKNVLRLLSCVFFITATAVAVAAATVSMRWQSTCTCENVNTLLHTLPIPTIASPFENADQSKRPRNNNVNTIMSMANKMSNSECTILAHVVCLYFTVFHLPHILGSIYVCAMEWWRSQVQRNHAVTSSWTKRNLVLSERELLEWAAIWYTFHFISFAISLLAQWDGNDFSCNRMILVSMNDYIQGNKMIFLQWRALDLGAHCTVILVLAINRLQFNIESIELLFIANAFVLFVNCYGFRMTTVFLVSVQYVPIYLLEVHSVQL